MKKVLTIAGSDCSGGAGIQADIKTMSAHGVYAMSVIVSVVAENTFEVVSIEDLPDTIIKDQIDCIYNDMGTDAVKIGMLSNKRIMSCVRDKLLEYKPENVVLDPVMYAKHGACLMQEDAIDLLIEDLIALCTCITPNIPEAERISGMKINGVDDMKKAAVIIHDMGARYVLVKGGHHVGDAIDILYDGENFHEFVNEKIDTKNTHGTGCTLSSAIASNLALGKSIYDAVKLSKEYITNAIKHDLHIGKGNGPTNHFYKFFEGELKNE